MAQPYAVAGIEPPLEEVLKDPITLPVMRRDGIDIADVRPPRRARFASAPPDAEELRGIDCSAA